MHHRFGVLRLLPDAIIGPLRITLAKKCADAFFGVLGQHIAHHHIGCEIVCIAKLVLDLLVKRFFADSDCIFGFAGDIFGEFFDLRVQFLFGCCLGADI